MQKEIQLTDKTLLVVGLPSKEDTAWINPYVKQYIHIGNIHGDVYSQLIPKGNWQLVGIYPELTEEQAKQVVTQSIHTGLFMYHNGIDNIYCYRTALESFQSLMERENITGYDKYAILYKEK